MWGPTIFSFDEDVLKSGTRHPSWWGDFWAAWCGSVCRQECARSLEGGEKSADERGNGRGKGGEGGGAKGREEIPIRGREPGYGRQAKAVSLVTNPDPERSYQGWQVGQRDQIVGCLFFAKAVGKGPRELVREPRGNFIGRVGGSRVSYLVSTWKQRMGRLPGRSSAPISASREAGA